MSWRDLLQLNENDTTIILPWVGGRSLHSFDRSWKIKQLPQEYDWYKFKTINRRAEVLEQVDPQPEILKDLITGYLIGDRIITDDVKVVPNISDLTDKFERVYLIEPGLDKFVRISAGRFYDSGPLIYNSMEMPLGSEDDVLQAFLDEKDSVTNISQVTPALDAAFRIESWRRKEAEKRRREEQERREREERRQRVINSLGDAQSRRELAREDFEAAARAALAVGGAQYLDHRDSPNRNEKIVRFRVGHGRYECVCNAHTLGIIDSGICLTAEYSDNDFEVGTRVDRWFSLETLPLVILQAERQGRLVIFRHVN